MDWEAIENAIENIKYELYNDRFDLGERELEFILKGLHKLKIRSDEE